MRVARCAHDGAVWVGVVDGDEVTLLGRDVDLSIDRWTAKELEMRASRPVAVVARRDVVLLAPVVAPTKIICVGLNYRDHAIESGLALPDQPLIFSKFPSAIIGPGARIVLPEESDAVDWEVELAVVIGTSARHVRPADALDVVAGYTIAVDISARDLQVSDGQFVRAKSYDTFCPLGPWLVTVDELGAAAELAIGLKVNGETMQRSNTSELVFGIRDVVAFCSRVATLNPGDVILTGTPSGTGYGFDPQRYLNPGDEVVAWVEGIGELSNPVAAQ